jgi:hypothetical protein
VGGERRMKRNEGRGRKEEGREQKKNEWREEKYTSRIEAVSIISAIKVETPRSWESLAPIRAMILSTGEIFALLQGTKLPI